MENKFDMFGIKCDKVGCGYHDDSVSSSNYQNYLNKPCPKCGSNLLTEQDLKSFQAMQKILNSRFFRILNAILKFFGAKDKKFEVQMNGTGKVVLKEKE